MLTDAYRDERPGIRIAYRTDGHLLNHRLMHFQSRVSTTPVHDLLFADDYALNATSEWDMQRSMELFGAAYDNFGLVINTEKTLVMRQPKYNAVYVACQITVNGAQLESRAQLHLTGQHPLRNTKIDDKTASRTFKASQTFGRLKSTV
nr:unnamed protein product [Spirometra erinaceieuropaei]